MVPAAFIEAHRFQVIKAQRQLADHQSQDYIVKDREKCLVIVNSIDDQIDFLGRNQARLEKNKAILQFRSEALPKKWPEMMMIWPI